MGRRLNYLMRLTFIGAALRNLGPYLAEVVIWGTNERPWFMQSSFDEVGSGVGPGRPCYGRGLQGVPNLGSVPGQCPLRRFQPRPCLSRGGTFGHINHPQPLVT